MSLRLFKALGDETRLRILQLLEEYELSVSELVRILSVHQSNISRHLNHLREAGMVHDHKEGALTWFSWSKELKQESNVADLLRKAFAEIAESAEDLAFAAKIIEERKLEGRKFFDQIAGRYKDLASPGGGREALIQAFLSLHDFDQVADLGCGEGELSLLLARHSKQISAIDLSPSMLEVLKAKAKEEKIFNIHTQLGDIEQLPLEDSSQDLALLSQALHHASSPLKALREAFRILKPLGKLLILDLKSHEHDWMREKMSDLWLGFEAEEITQWLNESGFKILKHSQIQPELGIPVLIFTAIKPSMGSL